MMMIMMMMPVSTVHAGPCHARLVSGRLLLRQQSAPVLLLRLLLLLLLEHEAANLSLRGCVVLRDGLVQWNASRNNESNGEGEGGRRAVHKTDKITKWAAEE